MKSYDLPKPRLCKSIIEYKVTSYVLRVVVPILVSISFSRNNKNVFRNNRFQQIERYVFLRRPWYENDSLIHVLCASSQLWGLHGGAVLLDHS
jgi:hypothetical protein